MANNISITKAELHAALTALERTGPVLSAHKRGVNIMLRLCGDKRPLLWKPPRKEPARPEKTATPKRKAKAAPKRAPLRVTKPPRKPSTRKTTKGK